MRCRPFRLLPLLLAVAATGCEERAPAPQPPPPAAAPSSAPPPEAVASPASAPAPSAPPSNPPPSSAASPTSAAPAPAPVQLTAEQREAARATYESRCATCHGPQGAGDGPAARGLEPAPRNLQDAAWQRTVTDEHLERVITGGGLAVGKSVLMPPSPDLRGRPELAALRAYVRSLAKK
ncbi:MULTISPECIES: cytochrome c [Myxococcaceae]|uniref:c-type cytochrome n=1 Tax=Myxococcaceae TaxID=31 RepID=UPI00188E2115|nr:MULTISPECIES: cytochrome c [Myxococcaceae]MBF5045746.1 cytochrome c [Simulacricoccus sp. 17bor-14]